MPIAKALFVPSLHTPVPPPSALSLALETECGWQEKAHPLLVALVKVPHKVKQHGRVYELRYDYVPNDL